MPACECEKHAFNWEGLRSGSALVFDDRIFHYGGANESSQVRTYDRVQRQLVGFYCKGADSCNW